MKRALSSPVGSVGSVRFVPVARLPPGICVLLPERLSGMAFILLLKSFIASHSVPWSSSSFAAAA